MNRIVLFVLLPVLTTIASGCIGFALGYRYVPKAFERGYIKGHEVARARFSNVIGFKQQPHQPPEPPRQPRPRSWP